MKTAPAGGVIFGFAPFRSAFSLVIHFPRRLSSRRGKIVSTVGSRENLVLTITDQLDLGWKYTLEVTSTPSATVSFAAVGFATFSTGITKPLPQVT